MDEECCVLIERSEVLIADALKRVADREKSLRASGFDRFAMYKRLERGVFSSQEYLKAEAAVAAVCCDASGCREGEGGAVRRSRRLNLAWV